MTRIATLRCPCVHSANYKAALQTLKTIVQFEETDVRCNPNLYKPSHWIIYVDVHAFLNFKFESDFTALQGKDCLKVFLPNKAFVLVGIGKSQEQCDAEEDALAAAALTPSTTETGTSGAEEDASAAAFINVF